MQITINDADNDFLDVFHHRSYHFSILQRFHQTDFPGIQRKKSGKIICFIKIAQTDTNLSHATISAMWGWHKPSLLEQPCIKPWGRQCHKSEAHNYDPMTGAQYPCIPAGEWFTYKQHLTTSLLEGNGSHTYNTFLPSCTKLWANIKTVSRVWTSRIAIKKAMTLVRSF